MLGPQAAAQVSVVSQAALCWCALPGPGTGLWRKESLPSVSVHHHVSEFHAVAEKAPEAMREYSLAGKVSREEHV